MGFILCMELFELGKARQVDCLGSLSSDQLCTGQKEKYTLIFMYYLCQFCVQNNMTFLAFHNETLRVSQHDKV